MGITPMSGTAPVSRTYWYFYQAADGELGVVGFVVHADRAVTVEWLGENTITMAQHYPARHPLTLMLFHYLHIDRLHQDRYEFAQLFLRRRPTLVPCPIDPHRSGDTTRMLCRADSVDGPECLERSSTSQGGSRCHSSP